MSPLIMSPQAWKHDIVPNGAEGASSLPPCASQTQDQGSSTMVVHHLTVPPSSWSPVTNSRRSASPSSSGSICGKRSRSNSSSSSTSASTSDSGSSIFSNNVNNFVGSPATSLSGASDSDEERERICHSPSAGKRKALRRAWRNDACTAASATRPRASKTAKKPSASSAGSGDDSDSALSLTSATSSPRSDEDVRGLDGAVQAFGLSSREHTPESSQPGVISTKPAATAPSKSSLVDHLVDAAVATIDAIWHSPLSTSKQADMPPCTASGLPLSTFIRETLRRSRTSCSTLQAALLYCLRCAPAVRKQRMAFESLPKAERDGAAAQILSERAGLYSFLLCGRRIFLASVMVASKFLQDKNFSNKAWSSLTGLPLKQLGLVEREFLAAIGWDLNVKQDEWTRWCHKLTEAKLQKSEGCQGNIRASHTLTAPSPSPSSVHTSLQHKALAIVKAAAIDDRQDRSGSSTPTPAALRPRGNLSRIHSDDGPLKAFDTALTPTAVGQHPQGPMSMGATHAKAARELTPPVTVPQPYPMPRAFVRSAHSFSSGGDRLSALQTPQGLLAGGDVERQ